MLLAGRFGDAHHGAPGDAAFQVGRKRRRQLVEADAARDDASQVARPADPWRCAATPPAASRAASRGVDAQEAHAPQDEGHDGGLELRRRRRARRWRCCPRSRRMRVSQASISPPTLSMAPPNCALSSGREPSRARRAAAPRRRRAREIVRRLRLAADGDDLVAAPREHVDRRCCRRRRVAPVTTMGPPCGRLAVLLHAVDGERGGEAGGADRHGGELIEPRRHRDHPVPGHARVLGIAAIVGLGQAAAGDQHRLARLEARDRADDSTTPARSMPPTSG